MFIVWICKKFSSKQFDLVGLLILLKKCFKSLYVVIKRKYIFKTYVRCHARQNMMQLCTEVIRITIIKLYLLLLSSVFYKIAFFRLHSSPYYWVFSFFELGTIPF